MIADALHRLDPDQRAAVLADEPATLVHAQVGSGKTTVLVHRAAHLHVTCGVPLERIAIVTFTNRAAAELRVRLAALLGRTTSDREGWLVGTFHAVASAVLRRALPRRFTILDDEQAIELAVEVARRMRVRPGRRATLRDRLRTDPSLAELAAAIAAERHARDAMDFDDLIEQATTQLAGAASPAAHVLVDELQDCEPRDLAFVRALVGPGTQVFAVGDPLQSIYGWRGATPELFAQARMELRCQVRALARSYRSTSTVLAGARAVLGDQPTVVGELAPARGAGAAIAIVRHHDVTAEAAYLAMRLAALHAEGVPWREVAVLCRLRAQIADLVAALATRGVPCVYDLDAVETETPIEAGAPAGVRVLTIHAAKGLEFTHVFVSGANVGVLPLLSRNPDADAADQHADLREERRLLYVALTRARDSVEISYHACPHAFGAFGVASPFLALLPADVVTRSDVAPSPPSTSGWHVGQRVRHARYGSGTITAIAGDTIACDFGKLGPRAFPRALCPLVGASARAASSSASAHRLGSAAAASSGDSES